MKRYATGGMAALLMAAISSSALAQTVAVWDGGDDSWDAAKWNGGMTAAEVFGDNRMSNGSFDVTIGGGAQVSYDSGLLGGFRPRSNEGPTTITIKEGALWHHITPTDGDPDGNWTVWDADVNLDNGTLRRTFDAGGTAESGGLLMFGSWRSVQNQQINVNTYNGGKLENDGQVWFGADEEHGLGLRVKATINNGSWDLTGGDNYPTANNSNDVLADLAFFYGSDVGEGNGSTNTGLPKNEKYQINFQGPGSITVDSGGIVVYRQDEFGAWDQPADGSTATRSTYEDLWNAGILKVKWITGKNGADFTKYFTTSGASGSDDYVLTSNFAPVTEVVWDGGNDSFDAAKWNGGMTAAEVFGDARMSNGAYAVTIGGGAQVTYDSGLIGGFRPRSNVGMTSLTIKEGALWHHITPTDGDPDGNWTVWDADINLDGGTLRRTFDAGGSAESGGLLMFGSWRSVEDQEIHVNVTNGGRLENDGQVWFGADEEHALGLSVSININNGVLDLTGGDNYPTANNSHDVLADMAFFYGADFGEGNGSVDSTLPKGEKYEINFLGPGSIIVDQGGIVVYRQDAVGDWDQPIDGTTATRSSYEDLWNVGILKANGLSGLDGATFSNFFSVTNTVGSENYTLTSLIAGGGPGDFDNDGDADGTDFLLWQQGNSPGPLSAADYNAWQGAFGADGAVAAASSVPEPASLALIALGTLTLTTGRRRRA